MKWMLGLLASAILVVGGTGCSSIAVDGDHDASANFAAYKTYAWSKGVEQGGVVMVSSLDDARIRRAVDVEMQVKGFIRDDQNPPDLFVTYFASAQDKFAVYDNRWATPSGWATGDVTVSNYTEGTLIIDLVDAKANHMVWRGSASGAIDPNSTDKEHQIQSVVRKIFNLYPPGR